MLKHNDNLPPMRVVILGAKGFIGKSVARSLEKRQIPCLKLGKEECDLLEKGASEKLVAFLRPTDSLLFLSTITPDKGKGVDAFSKNILMGEVVCKALEKVNPAHVVYLSSDTVYSLYRGIVAEDSPTDPENLYGVMHLAREYMLQATVKAPLALLRSSLIYGTEDTHNSYGPNRLRRMAQNEGKMVLFGAGEEKRDHISIHDVTELIVRVLFNKSYGILNLATGQSISYYELAHKLADLYGAKVETSERKTAITHRHFDVTAIYKAFPTFAFVSLDEGLKKVKIEESPCVTETVTDP